MHPKFLPKDLAGKLDHVQEECGEVIVAVAKIKRFGILSVNPNIPVSQQITNKDHLLDELQDLRAAISAVEMELFKQ